MPHQEWRDADGRKCPSVTEITGLFVSKDMQLFRGEVGNKRYDAVMKAAGDIGTRTHSIIEDVMERGEPTGASFAAEKEMYMADQALAWAKEKVSEVVAQEVGHFSATYRYGGTADLVARMKYAGESFEAELSIVDWKTSTEIYNTMGMQLAAYAWLYNEKMGLTWESGVNKGFILRLDKKAGGPPEARPFHRLDLYFGAFKGLRVLYDIVHGEGDFTNGGKTSVPF